MQAVACALHFLTPSPSSAHQGDLRAKGSLGKRSFLNFSLLMGRNSHPNPSAPLSTLGCLRIVPVSSTDTKTHKEDFASLHIVYFAKSYRNKVFQVKRYFAGGGAVKSGSNLASNNGPDKTQIPSVSSGRALTQTTYFLFLFS